MDEVIVRAEDLSKLYTIHASSGIGWRRNQRILTDDIMRFLSPRGKGLSDKKVSIWALKDVSFEAKQGEVIGLIGRNGAGKSTLLKLLGRVTEPTSGRAEIYGRVGSLLEVGTGFHSELTGRENIFISGAIIGMSRAEIKSKFDEIVSFSGVEEYLDTPVKRFSSGMEVRLAFSIAAHLRPQVLLVDEVLSVGDVTFQHKSLQKIKEVSQNGGTILFVSHNLSTVASVCSHVLVLDHGKVVFPLGSVPEAVNYYLSTAGNNQPIRLEEDRQRSSPGLGKITSFKMHAPDGSILETLTSRSPVNFYVGYEFEQTKPNNDIYLSILIKNLKGDVIANLNNQETVGPLTLPSQKGEIICWIDDLPLETGKITISIMLEQDNLVADYLEDVFVGTVDGGGHYINRNRDANLGWILIDQNWSVI